jgi:lysosomal acid lipase/cholesteryl ester hydrolase
MEHPIPLYTLAGVENVEKSTHPFSTDDGLGLTLERFQRDECDDVVVLIHGLTSSSDMFIMPEHYNLVSYLLDNGLNDVWCLDYRMSNHFNYNLYPNDYTMDDVALYDHPKALETVRRAVGENKRIHVIAHCVGSLTFTMAMAAGTVKGITSCIANSISLTPYIPSWSRFKISVFPFFLERILNIPYVSPGWPTEPRLTIGKLLSKGISLFHHECKEPSCHMLSLMWGSGFPALFEHENISEVTHHRLADLFGGTGLNYHRHVAKMVNANHRAVKMRNGAPQYAILPDDYFEAGLGIDTPILFVTGSNNRVFADSNIHCYEQMVANGIRHHNLKVFEKYGHQDMFMGTHCEKDVFPSLLGFIREHQVTQ